MSHATRYESGLYVVEQTRDERQVQRELRAIDPELFLDKERDLATGAIFYTVKARITDHPAGGEVVVDWRDPDDRPRPLTSGLLLEVKRMIHRLNTEGPVTSALIAKRNEEAQARRRKASDDAYMEIAREFEQYESAGHSPVLHRGQHLRRARDRMRASGRKV